VYLLEDKLHKIYLLLTIQKEIGLSKLYGNLTIIKMGIISLSPHNLRLLFQLKEIALAISLSLLNPSGLSKLRLNLSSVTHLP
jgi:hypothetical protein